MQNRIKRYGNAAFSVSLFLFIILIFFNCMPDSEVHADSSDYLDHLLKEARQKKLHEQRYWWILLHYKKTLFSTESLIDDPKFFLSPNGKFDPKSELESTIKTFFQKDNSAARPLICRFIARYTWLKEQLEVDESKITVLTCEKINKIQPKSATLVFPTYFLNNPASMFGHTLIIIETDYTSKRLSQAVNYAGFVTDTNGFVYIVKGLLGFYKGFYSVLPYYKKIQEYSDINQRDIWEYKLNLSPSEVQRMVMHIVELENIYSDYYFFDENCSYNLLFLLEVARPTVNLTDQFSFTVMPIETILAVEKEGLIESVDYRPAKATKIRHKISHLSADHQKVALEILKGNQPPATIFNLDMDKDKKIRVIDLVIDMIQYQYAKKQISKSDYRQRLLNALKVRSKLGKSDVTLDSVPVPPQPKTGHKPRRASFGIGINEDVFFQEIGFRPAFADLLDMDFFLHQGAEIEFFDTRLRYYSSDHRILLENIDIINIISISPRDKFLRPFSWKINTGFTQKPMSDGEDALVYRLSGGVGMAFNNDVLGLFYAMFEPELNINSSLEEDYAAGMGLSAGMLRHMTSFWKFHLFARKMYFESGDKHHDAEVSLSQNIRLTQNQSINLNISWKKVFDFEQTETALSWYIYF